MNTKKVIIYSTSTCHYCVLAKRFFEEMGVAYTDKNVGIDRAAAQEMFMKTGGQMGVPVVDIGGQVIIGFQPEVFKRLINSN